MRVLPVVVAALLAATGAAPGQAPPAETAQPPVFAVGVDVVAVDASVVDADGRPVQGLGPEDFRVEVDGRPRRLVSVEYVGRDLEPEAPPATRPVHFSSNESASRGRLVLLLVDRGNIGRGGGREALKSASRFLDGLGPADRVGLEFIPGPGRGIEFTGDVEDVRRGLRGVVGTADRAGHKVPLAEAVSKIKLHDRLRWEQFLALQCGGSLPEGAQVISEDPEAGVNFRLAQVASCQRELEQDANRVYQEYRERSLGTQAALRTTLESLARIDGPKTLILISEGLGTESPAELRELGAAASRAQATLFVLLLDTSSADASVAYSAIASQEDRELESGGLYDLAAQARGAVLRVVGSGDAAFQRVSRELMGYYLLGFEPEPGDRDGRGHPVKVQVSRAGVTVRARQLLSIPATPPTPLQALASALRSPLVDRGLPLQVTAYALRDAAGDKVRVLIAARVGRASRPVSLGFALSSAAGKVAASRAYQGLEGGAGDWLEFTGEAVVAPDTYTLRLAVVDAGGRRGSVEHTVKAALVSAGGLEISDLVLAPGPGGGAVRPAVDLELEGEGLQALVEFGGRDRARVEGAAVAVELAESADGPALLRAPVATEPGRDGARIARLDVAGGLLPPGTYTARAEISLEGRPVAVVARPFRILPARAGGPVGGAPLATLLVGTEPFDRKELLAPETVGHFADRVAAIVPGTAPDGVGAALEDARQGRPEAMLDRLGDGSKPDARVAFLRGVSYYARGNLSAALTQLQDALRASSELFPAAVYLGACYAAAGKDLDAIGAWQTALIDESGKSPVLYALLGDALARTGENQQAVEILQEGAFAFPEDDRLKRRLAIATAKGGGREAALPLLNAWVAAHPDDREASLAMLALFFEGFAREASGGGVGAAERDELVRHARAYVASDGTNREVVACWLRYLEARKGG